MPTLRQVFAATVRRHRGGDGIEDIAERCSVGPSMVYRWSNPLDEDGCPNSKHILPVMLATKDYSYLKALAARCGFGVYRVPRVRTARVEELADFQRLQSSAMTMLAGFFAGGQDAEETLGAVRAEMDKAAGFIKAVETHGTPSLFEEVE